MCTGMGRIRPQRQLRQSGKPATLHLITQHKESIPSGGTIQ